MVILNSIKSATDLLEKKSCIYSDRPTFMMGGEIVGFKNILALTPYGDRFRAYRRYLFRLMGGHTQMKEHHTLIHVETHKFLRRVLNNPDEVAAHIRE